MIFQDLPLWITLPFLFILGTVLGSFLNVCIYRMPKHERLFDQLRSLSWPPSHCPYCKNGVRRWDNLPVIGWLKLLGRCHFCRIRISPRYPLIEFGNGLLFVIVYWMEIPENVRHTIQNAVLYSEFGPQRCDIWATGTWLHWRYFYHMVLLEALVVATFIDFDEMIIPDGSTVPAMVVGLLGAFGFGQVFVVPVWFQDSSTLALWGPLMPEWFQPLLTGLDFPAWISAHPHWHGLAVSVAGFLVGGGVVWGVRIVGHWVMRREAMGFGDVILMAMIGSFLGWQAVLIVFFIAPFCALLFALIAVLTRRSQEIPYGPYLSVATLLLILGWKSIWPRAENFFSLGAIVPLVLIAMPVVLAGSLLLLQFAKHLLGIPLNPPEFTSEWRSADQLMYLNGENIDDQQGRWKSNDQWPGQEAGRGTVHETRWRHGSIGDGSSLNQ